MIFPHTVTVFNIVRETADDYTTTVNGYAAVLHGVFLRDIVSKKTESNGARNQSASGLYIPFDVKATDAYSGRELKFIDAELFCESPEQHWTIKLSSEETDHNCFFMKGAVTKPVDFTAITSLPGIRKIEAIETCDYGSSVMQHWEVAGK